MQTEYFQGKDGYIWWHGVVEDRKDPLFLGRCRVRILGWHTENKAELPTEMLPWAQVLMPITSASQTGVGEAPVGPVEGTWVMGFYRDGELAQEPVMVGTLPGIPERYAKQNTGFYDSRLDTLDTDLNAADASGKSKPDGAGKSLKGFPYPPKNVKVVKGQEVEIEEWDRDLESNRNTIQSKFLYPREKNKPTTSIYARGSEDSSSEVETRKKTSSESGSYSIIARKTTDLKHKPVPIETEFTTNPVINKTNDEGVPFIPTSDLDSFNYSLESKTIQQPPTPYAAIYPFNHVYESESGHLVEIDDTPGKERLHWYHRAGTFTEFHPKGMRVDRTNSHRYNITMGNLESIVGGEEKKKIQGDYTLDLGGHLTMQSSDDVRLFSREGSVLIDSKQQNTVIQGKHIVIGARDTLILKGGTKIIRDDDAAEDKVRGSYKMEVQGGYNLNSGKLSLGSMGSTSISSFGPMTQVVTGNSEETIANVDVIFGNTNAKMIKALLGKIVLETVDAILTGGIQLNVGPGGVAGQIAIKAPLGDIDIKSTTGPSGINIQATTQAKMKGLLSAEVEGTATAKLKSSGITQIEGGLVTVGGQSSPALLAKDFLKLFAEHYHPSSVGPTGPLHPSFAGKLIQTMSKKVFLG